MDKTTFKVLLEKVRPLIERDRIPNRSLLLRIAMLIRYKVTAMFSYFVRVGAIFSCLQDFPPIL
jgi:hypothetical protein